MPTAEAHVRTERPTRYLDQLCRHAGRMRRHLHHRSGAHGGDDPQPPEVRQVEWSDTYGIVRLAGGQWTLRATEDTLILRAEAGTEHDLRRIQHLLAGRMEKIGRRDHLTVTWQRLDPATAPPVAGETTRRRSRTATWVLVAVVALFLAVHLGLGGAAVAASSWTVWTAAGVLAILLLKVIGLRLLATRGRAAAHAARQAVGRLLRR